MTKKIKAKCFACDTVGYIPEDYQEWIGGDEHSCDKCKSRNGKVYTIQEMREILNSEFCDSDPFEQGCRCTIGAHKE